MFNESHGENIGDDRFALRRFQTRAMRHAVNDSRPIFGAVMPEHRQRVAFDAAMDEKRAAFAQHRKIDMLSLSRGRHLRSNRRHVVGRFATDQQASERDEDRHLLHLRGPYRKLRAVEIRLVLRVSRLRQSGDRHKPISMAIREVRPDKKISDLCRVAPLWKYKFVQQFYSRGNAWRDFIACTERLAKFAFAFGQTTSFPYRFKCCIISEDKWSKVFLADQLRFQLDQSITCS